MVQIVIVGNAVVKLDKRLEVVRLLPQLVRNRTALGPCPRGMTVPHQWTLAGGLLTRNHVQVVQTLLVFGTSVQTALRHQVRRNRMLTGRIQWLLDARIQEH
uniref:(northern house mosquito) hypothetical protein n=1 Tax=Culex pipiens TaxID=7175 RepID=A0A8D8JW56_CULPI